MEFSIFRFDPDKDDKPYMQDYAIEPDDSDRMLLDVILRIQMLQDDSLTIRKSCREGICGSDGINITGRTGLACITPGTGLKRPGCLGAARTCRSILGRKRETSTGGIEYPLGGSQAHACGARRRT